MFCKIAISSHIIERALYSSFSYIHYSIKWFAFPLLYICMDVYPAVLGLTHSSSFKYYFYLESGEHIRCHRQTCASFNQGKFCSHWPIFLVLLLDNFHNFKTNTEVHNSLLLLFLLLYKRQAQDKKWSYHYKWVLKYFNKNIFLLLYFLLGHWS